MWIVISDTHIGDNCSNNYFFKLCSFLKKLPKDITLVLNGDIFDFSKNPQITSRHKLFISHLIKFNKVIYIEGNHDWFVSSLKDINNISFKKQLDIGNIKIIHGHQADSIVTKFPKFSRFVVKINKIFYQLTGIDLQRILQRAWFSQKILITKQEEKLVKDLKCNIVIGGHTHKPNNRTIGNTLYLNTGDWISKSHQYYVLIDSFGNTWLKEVK